MKPEIKADVELDLRGLKCPLPIIKTKKKLDEMRSGQVILVISDDIGAKSDFPAFCTQAGHELIDVIEERGFFKFYIRKR